MPMSNCQLYCSCECQKTAAMERKRELKYEREQWELNITKRKAAPSNSIEDVMRFADEYKTKHGRYIQYGEAVQLMEGGKDDG